MKSHIISQKPEVLDWQHLPAVKLSPCSWTPTGDIGASAQICCDGEDLYIRLAARETHIRAEHTGPLGMPCEDSCLEFFFCPVPGDDRYFNFEFNPNGCMFLGMGTGPEDLVRLIPDQEDLFLAKPRRMAEGWELTFCVPGSFVRRFFPQYAPKSGGSIRANFYKCGDLTRQEHYLSWNPMTSPTPAFHRPCDFGCLTFE